MPMVTGSTAFADDDNHGSISGAVHITRQPFSNHGGSSPIAFLRLSKGFAPDPCAGAIVFTSRLFIVMTRYRSIPCSGVRPGSLGSLPSGGLYPSPQYTSPSLGI